MKLFYFVDGDRTILRNLGNQLPNYTASVTIDSNFRRILDHVVESYLFRERGAREPHKIVGDNMRHEKKSSKMQGSHF